MTEPVAPADKPGQTGSSSRQVICAAGRFIGLLGWCFFVALIYILIAFPLIAYFGSTAVVNGDPLFGGNAFFTDEVAILVLRIVSALLIVAFFVVFCRLGVPLYMKGLRGNPPFWRVVLVLASPMLVIALSTIFFGVLMSRQQGAYPQALLTYLDFSLWPFAVLVPLAGILSGLTKPLPGALTEPPELTQMTFLLKKNIKELVKLIDRASGVIDPFLQGNLLAASLAATSFAAIITAGISTEPVVALLLFAIPMVNACGDLPAVFLTDSLWGRLSRSSGPIVLRKALYVVISFLLIPGFVCLSLLVCWLGYNVIDSVYGSDALHWREHWQGFLEAPLEDGLGVALVVLSPAYWVLALIARVIVSKNDVTI